MKTLQVIHLLQHWADQGRGGFTHQDLVTLLVQDSPGALAKKLERLVGAGVLVRACRGVYVNALAAKAEGRLLERIAEALRRGHYSYVSLESMLSEHGLISQVLMDRLTVMITGRKGEYP